MAPALTESRYRESVYRIPIPAHRICRRGAQGASQPVIPPPLAKAHFQRTLENGRHADLVNVITPSGGSRTTTVHSLVCRLLSVMTPKRSAELMTPKRFALWMFETAIWAGMLVLGADLVGRVI